jgi:hypothetical protein
MIDVASAIRGERGNGLFATFEDGLRAREIADALIPSPGD